MVFSHNKKGTSETKNRELINDYNVRECQRGKQNTTGITTLREKRGGKRAKSPVSRKGPLRCRSKEGQDPATVLQRRKTSPRARIEGDKSKRGTTV